MIGILKTEIHNSKDKDFFAIESLNKLSHTPTPACLFCDTVANDFILPINTNVLKRTHVFNFDGIIITDDLMRSQDFIYTTYATKRFLYLYHLDWPYIKNLRFSYLKKILLNKDIELIARSSTHATLIQQLFKKPKYIMPEWDYEVLIEIDNNE
jgi:hypothetical protein|tara:strand:- start:1444 stop:1905 length:462 start_codon:yes stop_codon:yes gene_type:complete